jgi:hypothetical protein
LTGGVITYANAGPYPGFTGAAIPDDAIVLYHNTTSDTWQVIYDPDIENATTTSSGPYTVIADLGSNSIDTGDVVLG